MAAASCDSIGSCSLDVDVTAGDSASELLCDSGSVSERTLHSLSLSAARTPVGNPAATPEYVKRTAQLFEDPSPTKKGPGEAPERVPNGVGDPGGGPAAKKPSYLALACSISGYTTITNYDSKLREGFRSRDHSPGRLAIVRSREVSPIRPGQDSGVGSRCKSDCGNFLTPPRPPDKAGSRGSPPAGERPAVDGRSGSDANMSGRSDGRSALRESSRSFVSAMLSPGRDASPFGCGSPSRWSHDSPTGVQLGNGFPADVGPANGSHEGASAPDGRPQRRSPGAVRVVEFTSHTKSYVQNGTSAPPERRGGGDGAWTGTPSARSFVQQRVERLYGPGALAQGFFRRAAHTDHSAFQVSHESSSNGNLATLPVLRHLRPEFRAQLSLGSRKEAKNTENQVVRIIPIELEEERIVRAPEKGEAPPLQQQISVESLSEHLPAAPDVVLPPQQVAAPTAPPSEPAARDGAYFLAVLRRETDRLDAAASAVEADLEGAETPPEEVAGQMRAAAGQARLLVKQKLQQFEGLCHKNLSQDPEEPFPTTSEDLAGFWDMVKLQVDQVHGVFAGLDRAKAAGWRKEESLCPDKTDGPAKTSSVKKRASGPSKRTTKAPANEEARKAREEARKKLMEEKRKQMREKSKRATADDVEIFVPQENGK